MDKQALVDHLQKIRDGAEEAAISYGATVRGGVDEKHVCVAYQTGYLDALIKVLQFL